MDPNNLCIPLALTINLKSRYNPQKYRDRTKAPLHQHKTILQHN